MYNIIKCPVTVHTVCSCRPLSYLSVVFYKMSSVRIFPLSENIFVQEMRRKYLIVIGRPGPKTQHSGPAEHLSDVNQLETQLVWPCRGNKRSLVPTAPTQTAVPGKGRHWNDDVSAWHRWVEPRDSPSSIAGHNQEGCDWCSTVLLRMLFGQNYSAISFSREVQHDTGISEWPFSQTVVFLLGEAYSSVWGKSCKQHRFACPQLLARSNSVL